MLEVTSHHSAINELNTEHSLTTYDMGISLKDQLRQLQDEPKCKPTLRLELTKAVDPDSAYADLDGLDTNGREVDRAHYSDVG